MVLGMLELRAIRLNVAKTTTVGTLSYSVEADRWSTDSSRRAEMQVRKDSSTYRFRYVDRPRLSSICCCLSPRNRQLTMYNSSYPLSQFTVTIAIDL